LSSPESRKAQCESYASIFMLAGNPGIVWHPETGQCVKTKLETEAVRSRTVRKFEIDATKAENL
jgi:hypothetical protein